MTTKLLNLKKQSEALIEEAVVVEKDRTISESEKTLRIISIQKKLDIIINEIEQNR